jgi:hypothetical protein
LFGQSLQNELGLHHVVFHVGLQLEAQPLANGSHLAIFCEHIRCDLLQFLAAGNVEQPAIEFGSKTLALELVSNQRGDFGFFAPVQFAQPTAMISGSPSSPRRTVTSAISRS